MGVGPEVGTLREKLCGAEWVAVTGQKRNHVGSPTDAAAALAPVADAVDAAPGALFVAALLRRHPRGSTLIFAVATAVSAGAAQRPPCLKPARAAAAAVGPQRGLRPARRASL